MDIRRDAPLVLEAADVRLEASPGGWARGVAQARGRRAVPGAVGWHPWLKRRLSGAPGRPAEPSAPVEIHLDAEWMYARDADGLPTGELIEPTAGPWDDCFTGLRSSPRLTWPGVLGLEMTSSCNHWVVYDEPVGAVCVEPQTAPPDFVNIAPSTTVPGEPLVGTMTWRWWALD